MLTVCDADGLIEFGTRNHCFVGPDQELRVEEGWDFSSITGPNRKSMKLFIAESLGFSGDERIRQHVRLTDRGHIRAARLAVDWPARLIEPKPKEIKTDWRDVQRRLMKLYNRGERYTTIVDLAERMECGTTTIHKAIKDSAKLKGWQARHTKAKGSPRASSMTDFVLDNAEQNREPDPSDVVDFDPADAALAKLLDDATPDERAKIQTMSIEKQYELAHMARSDPDSGTRVLGRKP
ncbi:MAG: hypothetical protein O7G85_09400 [Planctomycetota bacterium]|nr:hypothetical protein [Planctomycetota bacterium]